MSSEFVEEVFASLRRRSKAIKYYARLTVTRRTPFNPEQGADLEIELRNRPLSVRLWVWSDRWVWLDAREYGTRRKGGWVWSKTVDGRTARCFCRYFSVSTALFPPPTTNG